MSQRRSVFKKSSPNGKLIVYLAGRDFWDDLESVDPVEGVVVVEPEYLKDRKLNARIECEFRYGREDMDGVMAGVQFKKAFYFCEEQLSSGEKKKPTGLSPLLEKLIQKFPDGYPFHFSLPHDIPASISLQQSGEENPENQPCGIEYRLQVFPFDNKDKEPHRHNAVQVVIRRLTTAVPKLDGGFVPSKEVDKQFHLHSGGIKVEASLGKEVFYHGETIPVNIVVDNYSSNSVKRVKLQIVQLAEVTLFRPKMFRSVIQLHECEAGLPIEAGQSGWCQTYKLRPSIVNNRHIVGLALDGKLKYQDTNLASSTLIKDFRKKELMGIVVQYLIRIKVVTGFGGRNTELEIPFILTHARPEDASRQAKVNKPPEDEEVVFERFGRMKFPMDTNSKTA